MTPSPEQHKAALASALRTFNGKFLDAPPGCSIAVEAAIRSYVSYLSALPEQTDRTAELVARGMWKSAMDFIGMTEGEAIAVSGDDWHQYLPDAEKLIAEHSAPPAGEAS